MFTKFEIIRNQIVIFWPDNLLLRFTECEISAPYLALAKEECTNDKLVEKIANYFQITEACIFVMAFVMKSSS
jgi:hypothetical protein